MTREEFLLQAQKAVDNFVRIVLSSRHLTATTGQNKASVPRVPDGVREDMAESARAWRHSMSSYKALVDVTGTFNDWTLSIQEHRVPLQETPAGAYHAEAVIEVAADKKVSVYWFAKGMSGVDWVFTISLALLDASGIPGPAVTWSEKGTLPAQKQVGINGVLLISSMKPAAPAAPAASAKGKA
jgi:hypothetical protein